MRACEDIVAASGTFPAGDSHGMEVMGFPAKVLIWGVLGAGFAMAANTLAFVIIGKINRKLPENQASLLFGMAPGLENNIGNCIPTASWHFAWIYADYLYSSVSWSSRCTYGKVVFQVNYDQASIQNNRATQSAHARYRQKIHARYVACDSSRKTQPCRAIAGALPAITQAVDAIVHALQNGGRLFYVGAGTSGRLATLDAAELPPTFGTPPNMVQAIIAGGRRALTHAVEGAEDDRAQGARDLAHKKIKSANDVVVGIAASGSTPYVLGRAGIRVRRQRGAVTVGVTSNPPNANYGALQKISIVTPTGPEVITGSTRMKAGTAQKLVLNMLSTASMIRMGRVYDNWMIGVALTNRKLQARGLRILAEASGATVAEATQTLRQSGHTMDVAFIMLKGGLRARQAGNLLRSTNGNIREALDGLKLTIKGRNRNQMDKLLIEGGRPLEGSVRISGAKNAALPAMAAALLTSDRVELDNIPRVRDIITMGRLLAHMTVSVETPELPPTVMIIQAKTVNGAEAPYELVRTMRASILTLGPLVGAHMAPPACLCLASCSIGARPVDLHLKALEQMGAEIGTSHGYVEARVPGGGRLRGGHVFFDKITVTGTENVLMAAALAEGETQIENAAREPEITDLADLLIKMGAEIEGAGTSTILVRGKQKLHGAQHTIIPDRIEAGTFLVAGAITNGSLELTGCAPEHLISVIAKLRETGVEIRETAPGTLCVHGAKKLVAADVRTEEYPGFATDMQAQFMALVTQAEGTSVITETIFENRFLHASEMMRIQAPIFQLKAAAPLFMARRCSPAAESSRRTCEPAHH